MPMDGTFRPDTLVTTEAALLALYRPPGEMAKRKVIARLDQHCRRFIALSPFVVVGTADAEGRHDVSPRGDAPGFVGVLDERTLVLPDRKGNNRLDSFRNLLSHPGIALLFMIPGINDTLRVNGTARLVADPAFCARFEAKGNIPPLCVVVTVAEAFLRSGLWTAEAKVERSALPSPGKMLADHIADGTTEAEVAALIHESETKRLY